LQVINIELLHVYIAHPAWNIFLSGKDLICPVLKHIGLTTYTLKKPDLDVWLNSYPFSSDEDPSVMNQFKLVCVLMTLFSALQELIIEIGTTAILPWSAQYLFNLVSTTTKEFEGTDGRAF